MLLATAKTPRATYSLPGLLQCKQVDIYRAAAFAAVDTGIVRSLASMAPGICTIGHIAILQRAWMKRPFARLLPHLRINRVLLRVFDSPGISPVLSARLLSAISCASADELEEVTASWETFCEMVGLGFGKRQPLEMLSDISQWNRSLEHMPAQFQTCRCLRLRFPVKGVSLSRSQMPPALSRKAACNETVSERWRCSVISYRRMLAFTACYHLSEPRCCCYLEVVGAAGNWRFPSFEDLETPMSRLKLRPLSKSGSP